MQSFAGERWAQIFAGILFSPLISPFFAIVNVFAQENYQGVNTTGKIYTNKSWSIT